MMSGSNPQGKPMLSSSLRESLRHAADLLRAGKLVAMPTETVYGLAADATNSDAVAAIYAAKGRPDFNPLIVHVSDIKSAERLAFFDPLALELAYAFWPGPLTFVLPQRPDNGITNAVTAGLPTIALRCPAHPAMQILLLQSGLFIAAPSANPSGAISPTRAKHVRDGLGDKVALIVDGGPCASGIESTIIAIRQNGWQLLRPGPVTLEMLEAIAGPPLLDSLQSIEAPGQLASHYAPNKPLRLNILTPEINEYHIGFGNITGDENLAPDGDLFKAAARLFDLLHRADASDKTRIAVAPIPINGIGVAINDRLNRASA
jgi:L-threonylcarbamoyladenylate synthase